MSNYHDNPASDSPQQVRFEEERVDRVLDSSMLGEYRWPMLEAHQEAYGIPRLTFAAFRASFPYFPMALAARHINRISERVTAVGLFRASRRRFLDDLYYETYAKMEAESAGRPVGLIVPFDSFRGGMILHNGNFDTGQIRLIGAEKDAHPHRITMEPFSGVLSLLAKTKWSPEKPLKTPLAIRQATPLVPIPVRPEMVERLGVKPSVVILGWLERVLSSEHREDRRFVGRSSVRKRHVASTHKLMAEATGMSVFTFTRGLKQLRRSGLIEVRRAERGIQISLSEAG